MSLATAELRRAKLRFGLLASAVGLLVFLILFQQALLGRLVTAFIGAIRSQSAQVLVMGAEARGNLEASRVGLDTAGRVGDVEGVDVAVPIAEATFTVRINREQVEATLWGYPLDGPGGPTEVSDGRMAQGPGEAVVSDGDEAKGFKLGATVMVEPGDQAIKIVGVADDSSFSGNPVLYVSDATFENARTAVNPDATQVIPSAVAVRTADGADPERVAAAITKAVDGAEGFTRAQAEAANPGVSSVRTSFFVILALFYVVVPLVSGLFFLILTLQKANSLTLLRALGAPPGLLIRNLMVQVVGVVVVGVGLATLLLWGASQGANELGIGVEPGPVLITGGVILALALLASLAAIRRVLAIDPIKATTGSDVLA